MGLLTVRQVEVMMINGCDGGDDCGDDGGGADDGWESECCGGGDALCEYVVAKVKLIVLLMICVFSKKIKNSFCENNLDTVCDNENQKNCSYSSSQ